MIQSAIATYKEKNKKEVKTKIDTSTNDAGVVTISVINSETGEIIKQSNLGAIGNQQKGAEPKKATQGEQKAAVEAIISSYIGNKQQQAMISPEDLYRELLSKYPEAVEFLKHYWTVAKIRSATQKKILPM